MNTNQKFAVILSLTLLNGCGIFRKKRENSTKHPPGTFQLSADEQKNFDNWKGAIIKNCSADNAFAGHAPEGQERTIDLAVFMLKTNHSLALQNGKDFVLLDSPEGLAGNSISEINRSVSVNGNSNNFGAKLTRDGSHCKVEINGTVVHEAALYASFPVLVHGRGAMEVPKSSKFRVKITADGLLSHGLLNSFIAASIRPSELTDQLKEFFPDWKEEDLNQFFPATEKNDGPWLHREALQLDSTGAMPLISGDYPELPTSIKGWEIYAAPTGKATYRILIPVVKIGQDSIGNSADNGLWQVEVMTSWHEDAELIRTYEITNLTLQESLSEDPIRLTSCFQQRYNAFLDTKIYGTGPFSPSYDALIGPCAALSSHPDAALYADKSTRSIVSKKFSGISGSTLSVQYNQWETALKSFVLLAIEAGDDIKAMLDPSDSSPLIRSLLEYSTILEEQIEKHSALVKNRSFYLARLAFPWAFQAVEVQSTQVQNIVDAIANTAGFLDTSVESWLRDLARDPESQLKQIAYANGLDEVTLQTVFDLTAQATKLQIGTAFIDAKLSRVIQDQLNLPQLMNSWKQTLDALASFHERDLAKATSVSKISFDLKFRDLAAISIKEDWQETDYSRIEKIANFARKNLFCERYADTTTLVDCIGKTPFSRAKSAFLDPAFGDRYEILAAEFTRYHESLGDDSSPFVRQDLLSKFFQPIWKGCDGTAFETKSKELATLISQLLKADQLSKFVIERKIRALLDDCQ